MTGGATGSGTAGENRTLLVPAAGRGSRLGSELPKVLVPVAGTSMLGHLHRIYRNVADRWVLVVAPAARGAVADHCRSLGLHAELYEQEEPTGMLDAILIPGERGFEPAGRVWITWCDQVGVEPATVGDLAEADGDGADLVLPVVRCREPYIHFARDDDGTISRVLQRREGDEMPEEGESDMGLFSLSPRAYGELLPRYAGSAATGSATGERNFLPFIPWLTAHGRVRTIANHLPIERLGVNTPEDRSRMERHLAAAPGETA